MTCLGVDLWTAFQAAAVTLVATFLVTMLAGAAVGLWQAYRKHGDKDDGA